MADHQRAEDNNMPASIADVVKAVELDPDYWAKAPRRTRAKFIKQIFLHYAEKKDFEAQGENSFRSAIYPERGCLLG